MSKPIDSLESLIDWLKTKTPDEEYDYMDSRNCALYQYYKAKGVDVRSVDGYCRWGSKFEKHLLPATFIQIPQPLYPGTKSTFGHALKKAEAALAQQKEKVNG